MAVLVDNMLTLLPFLTVDSCILQYCIYICMTERRILLGNIINRNERERESIGSQAKLEDG